MDAMRCRRQRSGCCTAGAGLAFLIFATATSVGADALGLRVADGFEVSLYADDDLAHDIHCLTIDSLGRVVVSGPGYIRILIDQDGDGRADESRTFTATPRGAQGMYFHGRDLLCSAGDGLIRYRDLNGDDAADGPPDVFLRMKTGGEHDAHAIRRGPDGWWYLMVGNSGGVDSKFVSLPHSPVTQPRAGVLLRLSPDLTGGEALACGFRNPYDFTFDARGEIYAGDSDGERDVSLPWYLPNRVLQVLPGADAGWVTESWKRQSEFQDVMPAVADLGRGSPTGVLCYRHKQFPPAYQGATFVLDWTYGRILALPLQARTATTVEPQVFLTGVGGHGFAPTAAAVGPDGSMFVSVGGRGTRGSVYCIRALERPRLDVLQEPPPTSPADQLTLCLRCPEPLSSWARRVWEPLAESLGPEPFVNAAISEQRPEGERLRAIEILVEKFKGPALDIVQALARSAMPSVRARAVWALGRQGAVSRNPRLVSNFLVDHDPIVTRTALEALLAADPKVCAELVGALARCLSDPDPTVRQAAIRVIARADEDTYQAIAVAAVPAGWQSGLSLGAAYAARNPGVDEYTADVALQVLRDPHPVAMRREAARLLQLALGDAGPAVKGVGSPRPAVFDAYASPLDLTAHAAVVGRIREALAKQYPSGDRVLDRELARVAAMVQADDPQLLDALLQPITAESHPVDDLHQLIVAARVPAPRTEAQRAKVAEAIVDLDQKVATRKLIQDTHWNDRVMELYSALVKLDAPLPVALLQHPRFGRPDHAQYLIKLPPSYFKQAVEVFTRAVAAAGDDYPWNADVIYLLSQSTDAKIRERLRAQFSDYGLRGPLLLALAERPEEEDRKLFVEGLESSSLEVLSACVRALALLPARDAAEDNVALLRALRRLGFNGEELVLRDQLVEGLRRNTGHQIEYAYGRENEPQQTAIDEWTRYVQQTWPDEYAKQTQTDGDDLQELQRQLLLVDWQRGHAERGAILFQKRACQQCHGSSQAIGPDLRGAAGRFSRDDLFVAIAAPSRDVSPRYQAELIVTTDGESLTGLVVYEAVDGVVLRDAQNRTWRIEAEEIELRKKLTLSLMPTGLLKDLTPTDLADLYAYLQGLALSPAVERTAQDDRDRD